MLKQEQQQLQVIRLHVCLLFLMVLLTLGKALATVLQFISNDWTIEPLRLFYLQMLAKSPSVGEIARKVISVQHSHNETVKLFYPDLVDVTCYSRPLTK